MRPSDRRRGAILPMVLVLIAVVLPLSIFLAQRVSQDLLHTRMNSRIRTASSLANNMVTDILRQFSQNYQGDHYSAAALQRTPVRYAQGFSSLTVTSDANQHYLYFQGIGGYGDDVDHPENRKVIDGVIKFVSDLTTFGTMSNGNFTTSASNVTYLGKMWLNGDWSVSGSNITVNGGPVFVDGNLSKTGGGTLTINGDLYRTGTRSGAITVTGSDYNFMPQMTWPTIDRTYYDTYANVTVTADTAIRFRYDGASSTGTVLVGTTPYAIPSSGFIIYGKNCTLTSSGTLRGKVLPIGGLKEKLLAAHRGQITTIIIPKENEKDLKEVPKNILSDLTIFCVEHMDEVLTHALHAKHSSDIFKNNDFNIVMEEIYPKKVPVVPEAGKEQPAIVAH